MRILLDTGPLVALLNRRDAFHSWSVEQAGRLGPPFFSCEAVIAEAHFLLAGVHQGNQRLIDLIASGRIDLSFTFADFADRIGDLMLSYADVPMSFADACLVCMAEHEESTVFTLDSDFRIYRKHRKEALHLLIP
jgi:predicted nucleic acid-binding protein